MVVEGGDGTLVANEATRAVVVSEDGVGVYSTASPAAECGEFSRFLRDEREPIFGDSKRAVHRLFPFSPSRPPSAAPQ